MADELCFVQLPHPGRKHGPDDADGRLKRWERGEREHKRKFMRAPGAWREQIDGTTHSGTIRFWGEWEADSNVTDVADRVPGGPQWLHEPYFEGAENAPREAVPQNTDPFVFGERFFYTFCRQPRKNRLQQLARGSVILLGSRKDNEFVLDTFSWWQIGRSHTRDIRGSRRVAYEHSLSRCHPRPHVRVVRNCWRTALLRRDARRAGSRDVQFRTVPDAGPTRHAGTGHGSKVDQVRRHRRPRG